MWVILRDPPPPLPRAKPVQFGPKFDPNFNPNREVVFFSVSGPGPGFPQGPRAVLSQNGLKPPYFTISRTCRPKREM